MVNTSFQGSVIPARAGIQIAKLNPRLRGPDMLRPFLTSDISRQTTPTLEVVSMPGLAPVAQKQFQQILPL
jgi:hypothetical protein